ncbi:MAG: hypothetical protein V7K32_07930 [Nostoc sp.]|uniref:hypothetical protein n=1 Tax=Nostoc sp. TaxID=1180 RepID=UPI002FF72307
MSHYLATRQVDFICLIYKDLVKNVIVQIFMGKMVKWETIIKGSAMPSLDVGAASGVGASANAIFSKDDRQVFVGCVDAPTNIN